MDAKKIFSAAFYQLATTTPIEKITVAMLLDTSGLSRSTFYRHFADKYDVMNTYYQQYFEALNYDPQTSSWRELTHDVLNFMADHAAFFLNARHVAGQNAFLDSLQAYCINFTTQAYLLRTQQQRLSYTERAAVTFTCAGSIAVVANWLDSDFQESVATVTTVIYDNRAPLLRDYLE